MKQDLPIYIMFFILGIIALMAGQHDYETEQKSIEHYCNMVQVWEDSNGEHGWPPYRKNEVTCDTD